MIFTHRTRTHAGIFGTTEPLCTVLFHAAVFFFLMSGASALARNGETRTFDISGEPSLTLENVAGDILVERGSVDQIVVNYVIQNEDIKVEFDQKGDRVTVRTKYPRWGTTEGGVDFRITFPANGKLRVKSVSGDIEVQGVGGYLRLQSVSGRVEVSDAGGDLQLNSVSGDVIMSGIVDSTVDAASVSGDVDYRNGDLSGDDYNFSSTSGNVRIRHNASASYHLSGSTVSGSITNRVSDSLRIKEHEFTSMQSIDGSVNGNGTSIDVSTVSGNIYLEKD